MAHSNWLGLGTFRLSKDDDKDVLPSTCKIVVRMCSDSIGGFGTPSISFPGLIHHSNWLY